ncbi:putative necrosis and ethylene inducing peptide 2 precursor like protein [Zymoseptoria brevis]|uniref:Putative necrosis and ethylene inducing peptide 2 like protein n=1 Tax=Zymoseptoria brevis TaxID=1047168 RepID=A0A0F4GQ76_9PEZI|nr:putative necrosis and ethylene inducing peptide 2 precursor like protein [Zymoseptoria brevis]
MTFRQLRHFALANLGPLYEQSQLLISLTPGSLEFRAANKLSQDGPPSHIGRAVERLSASEGGGVAAAVHAEQDVTRLAKADSPADGLGHRHDWEGIVVWLSDAKASATLLGVAASAHGEYDAQKPPLLPTSGGTHPLIRYFSVFPLNHQLGFTSVKGHERPLIAWEELTDAARKALEDTDFGSATVPFKANFQETMDKAQLD